MIWEIWAQTGWRVPLRAHGTLHVQARQVDEFPTTCAQINSLQRDWEAVCLERQPKGEDLNSSAAHFCSGCSGDYSAWAILPYHSFFMNYYVADISFHSIFKKKNLYGKSIRREEVCERTAYKSILIFDSPVWIPHIWPWVDKIDHLNSGKGPKYGAARSYINNHHLTWSCSLRPTAWLLSDIFACCLLTPISGLWINREPQFRALTVSHSLRKLFIYHLIKLKKMNKI